jgi:hypothetical protein
MNYAIACLCALAALAPLRSPGAIGCTLSNPARDLKSLFPDMTSYREDVREFGKLADGRALYDSLRERLGSDLDPVYEAFETPYTVYSVFRDGKLLAYVHGVNVAGRGGVIQIFVSADPDTAEIRRMFFQRIESAGDRVLRARETRERFLGLTLADFYKHDYYAAVEPDSAADRVGRIPAPEGLAETARQDWTATLRGVRKNLLLLDCFVFDRRHEPFFERAAEARRGKGTP